MTDTITSTRPWTLLVAATGDFVEGTGKNGQPFMNFKGDITNAKGVKSRTVSVFNTLRFPTLIEDVKTALADGGAKMSVIFSYGGESGGESAKIVGVGYVDFRKTATPVEEAHVAETPVEETPVEEPVATPKRRAPRRKAA